jgi:hypothetical protein
MERDEYFRMKLVLFPENFINEYNICNKVDTNGSVHCKVQRGMYGIPQASINAQELLVTCLLKAGYTQSKITPGYWKHMWRPISFTLVVDNFGVKYSGKEHVHHLTQVLRQNYQIEEDWGGTQYIGLTVDWDYTRREVHISMPGYVEKALVQFGHQVDKDPQHQPHKHTILSYGASIQYAKAEDTSRPLVKDEKKYIQ